VVGENDGWLDVVSIHDKIEMTEVILNKRFD
jgi:hypothetical protein